MASGQAWQGQTRKFAFRQACMFSQCTTCKQQAHRAVNSNHCRQGWVHHRNPRGQRTPRHLYLRPESCLECTKCDRSCYIAPLDHVACLHELRIDRSCLMPTRMLPACSLAGNLCRSSLTAEAHVGKASYPAKVWESTCMATCSLTIGTHTCAHGQILDQSAWAQIPITPPSLHLRISLGFICVRC